MHSLGRHRQSILTRSHRNNIFSRMNRMRGPIIFRAPSTILILTPPQHSTRRLRPRPPVRVNGLRFGDGRSYRHYYPHQQHRHQFIVDHRPTIDQRLHRRPIFFIYQLMPIVIIRLFVMKTNLSHHRMSMTPRQTRLITQQLLSCIRAMQIARVNKRINHISISISSANRINNTKANNSTLNPGPMLFSLLILICHLLLPLPRLRSIL